VSNVVVFPKAKRGSPANTLEEILENVEMVRREQIEMIVNETLSDVFNYCHQEGFDITGEDCIKPTALVVESFRSALYNACGFSHPLQEFADNHFICEAEALLQTEKVLETIAFDNLGDMDIDD